VNFLNSVIIDLKRKNQELLTKIDVLTHTDILNIRYAQYSMLRKSVYISVEGFIYKTRDCQRTAPALSRRVLVIKEGK